MKFLKNHPFAVEAFFDFSLVLTFAFKQETIKELIPECLQLDTFEGKWAFVAIALVQTTGLRPKGFPKFLGNNFFLIGYRIFVRYKSDSGRRLRGLFILKSETNKKKMEILGNIFTQYNYATTDIQQSKSENLHIISSEKSKFNLTIEETKNEIKIPDGSPFSDWKQARRFAGPLPFTFNYNEISKKVLIIEGVRQNWRPYPIKIKNYSFDFLRQKRLQNGILANAFKIENIPYYWKKGRLESWK